MTYSVTCDSAPTLFRELLWLMKSAGKGEDTRNGKVLALQGSAVLTLRNPIDRVITDPIRDANPFFHVMEFVWMMAGSNDIQWIAQFNKRMLEYSDDGKTQHAAYGHRWRGYFGYDQIKKAIQLLINNPEDRRVVVQMWDAEMDLGHKGKDVPCNTQLMFRVADGKLNMTVTNRSNDLIWGAMGSNIVHFTMLQELVANACQLPLGNYCVFSNNLHMYMRVPRYDYYMGGAYAEDNLYKTDELAHFPLLQPGLRAGESYKKFVEDCEALVEGEYGNFHTLWMKEVGYPIFKAWFDRGDPVIESIGAPDWRIACAEWVNRRRVAMGNILRDDNAGLASGEQAPASLDIGAIKPGLVGYVDSPKPDVGLASIEPSPDGPLY